MEIVISFGAVVKIALSMLLFFVFMLMAFPPINDKSTSTTHKLVCAVGFVASVFFIHYVSKINFVFTS